MSTVHPREHEAELERMVTGELDAASGAARALRSCPTCRERLAELSALQEVLDALGAEEREDVLAAGQTDPDAAEEDPAVARRIRALAPAPPRRGRRLTVLVAAAAAVLLATFVWMRTDDGPAGPGPSGTQLGAGVVPLEPVGGVPAFTTFRWRHPLPPGGRYEVLVEDAASGAELLRVRTVEPAWTPPAEVGERLASRIRWRVTVTDAAGVLVAGGEAEAWRS